MLFELVCGIILFCMGIILTVTVMKNKCDYGRLFMAILFIVFFIYTILKGFFNVNDEWKQIQGAYIEPVKEEQYLIEEAEVCMYQEKTPGNVSNTKTIKIRENTIIEIKHISEGEIPYVLKYEKLG